MCENGVYERMEERRTCTDLKGVVVSVADRRGEPPERDRVVLETTPAPRDFAYEVRECARSAHCQPPNHGRWHHVLKVSEGLALERSMTDKSLEHGCRNRMDLAANCFPRVQVCNMHGTHGMSNGRGEHGLVPRGKTPIPSGKNSNTNWLATDM